MNPFARWLKETRERHHVSQEKLVDDINAWAAAEGMAWTLHRPNYNGWERGKGITDPLRDRLIAYWTAQGEDEPDLTPVVPTPEPDLAVALLALATELRAWREERESIEARLRAAEAELAALRAGSTGAGSRGRSAPAVTAG